MKARVALLAAILLVASAAALSAHDMFIKLDSYFLNPGDTLRVPILNGTFTTTENAIERERVLDLAVWGPNGLTHPAPLDWRASHDTTYFGLVLAKEGTYAAGVATKPRVLEMKGDAFNAYLKEEGLTDILERRTRLGQLKRPAKERYAKNVKAVFQVGETRTPTVSLPLGFPAEIIPIDNPYVGRRDATLRVQCVVGLHPLAGITVFAGSQHGHESPVQKSFTSDAQGIVRIPITRHGHWYVKFVRMTPVSGQSVDYVSEWATMTFEVR